MDFDLEQKPVSTTTTIVFPFYQSPSDSAYKYDTRFYKRHMTNNILSEDDVSKFFRELYQTVDGFKGLKSLGGSTAQNMFFYYIVGVYIIVGSLYTKTSEENIYNTIITWACGYGGIITLGYNLLFLLIAIREKTISEKRVFLKLQRFVDTKNQNQQGSNLTWCFPHDHFKWIELRTNNESTYDVSFSEKTVITFTYGKPESQYILHNPDLKIKKYKSEMTDDHLSESKLNEFLGGLGHIIQKHNYNQSDQIILFIAIGLIVEFLLFVLFRKTSAGRPLFFIILISFFICRRLYNKVSAKERELRFVIRDDLEEFLTSENNHFVSSGLRWHLPCESFDKLELWLDYKYNSDNIQMQSFSKKENSNNVYLNIQ